MTAAPTAAPVVPPGDQLAPAYRVVQHLSRGQALDVYEVFSTARLCSCVAKTVRPDRAHVTRVRDRLLQEGRLLQTLAHPHLLRGFETVDGAVPVVVTETLPGPTLEELVDQRRSRLPAVDLAHLGQQLCSAVQYLHDHDVLHLDVRPSNVLASGGRAVLIDLSLARPPGPARRGIGTDEHMSPEQARGDDLTAAADVWGIGVTLYEAATAVQPFGSPDGGRPRPRLQLVRPAAPLTTHRRGLPRRLVRAVHAALEPDASARPTVRELWSDLGGVLDEVAAAP